MPGHAHRLFFVSTLLLLLSFASLFAIEPTDRGASISETQLAPPVADLWSSSQYGVSVAVDGETAVVGAHRAKGPDSTEQGAAMVFERAAGVWTMTAKLTASDPTANAHFGWWVSVSGDCIVVTASRAIAAGGGAAYVFRRAGKQWVEEAILSPEIPSGLFGSSVAIRGETIVVAQSVAYALSSNEQGFAYVFDYVDGNWTQSTRLEAVDGAIGDSFATSIALDGDTLLLGAPLRDSAYVFTRDGGAWAQTSTLVSPSVVGDFGQSVALSGDRAIVGAPSANSSLGKAAIFVRNAGVWNEEAVLESSTPSFWGNYGWSVALNGATAAVGAIFEAGVKGSVHILTRTGTGWHESATFSPTASASQDEWFGWAAAMSQTTLVVGAPFYGGPAGVDPGAAYAYEVGLPGDVNCDGSADSGDRAAFLLALTDPPTFALRNAGCSMNQADLNGDGLVDGRDIGPFLTSTAP